jgi:hypothetical protein
LKTADVEYRRYIDISISIGRKRGDEKKGDWRKEKNEGEKISKELKE